MCKSFKVMLGIAVVSFGVLVGTLLAHSAPTTDVPATCKVTLSKAQEQVAQVQGKTIVLVGDQLKAVEASIRAFTQGQFGLEKETDAVIIASLPQGPNLFGEFSKGCMINAGPVPPVFIEDILKRIGQ